MKLKIILLLLIIFIIISGIIIFIIIFKTTQNDKQPYQKSASRKSQFGSDKQSQQKSASRKSQFGSDKNKMFKYLREKMFPEIFKGVGRNSAGFAWFKYLTEQNFSTEDFDLFNQMYCGVSGAIVDPSNPKNFDYIRLKKGEKYKMGKYYRCCDPCCSDLMREDGNTHEYGDKIYDVITIVDPCKNVSKIPKQVDAIQCEAGKTANGILSKTGRLIMAVLYPVDTENEKAQANYSQLKKKYENREKQDPQKIKGGMGDIFVKLSIAGK